MVAFREGVMEVWSVPVDQRAAALSLVFDWESESQRRQRVAACLHHEQSQDSPFEHLIEARRNGLRVGAAWGHLVPGRMANVWPPCLLPGESAETADVLQKELDHRLDIAQVACGQSLLPVTARAAAARLLRHGYSLAAQILFLACPAQQFPDRQPASELIFEPYRPDQRARLGQLIDETYLGTRDAPATDGLRSTFDVIDGYQRTGAFSPQLWRFVRQQERDIGCLLVTDHPQAGHYELIYMGLIPAARRRKLGEELARYAQWLAQRAGRDTILLGVDAANYPALVTYARCGFGEVDRRLAFVKRFSQRLPASTVAPEA